MFSRRRYVAARTRAATYKEISDLLHLYYHVLAMSLPFRTWIAALLLTSAFPTRAQTSAVQGDESPRAGPSLEIGTLRLQYGFSVHRGRQADVGPGLSFNGTTGNDVAVRATAYPSRALGASVGFQREGFVLYDNDRKVTSSSLYRASVGPSVRFQFGILSSQSTIGYAYAQLPSFGVSSSPQFLPGRRHSVLFAEVLSVKLPFHTRVDARGEYPLALAASDSAGVSAKSSGFAAGATVGVEIGRWHALSYGLAADYQFVSDRLSSNRATVTQTISRLGLSVELAWLPPEVPVQTIRYATLRLLVRQGDLPLTGVPIEIVSARRTLEVVTGADGRAVAASVPYGDATLRVHLTGYVAIEERLRVGTSDPEEVALSLESIRKTAGLLISVVETGTGKPLSKVTLTVKGEDHESDEQGFVSLDDLPLGLIEVTARKAGFQPAEEIASVISGRKSPLVIRLLPEVKRRPAAISGIVRSSTGKPLSATLQIFPLKQKLRANTSGEFRLEIEPGTYRAQISAPGYIPQTKTITVKDGEESIFDVELHRSAR